MPLASYRPRTRDSVVGRAAGWRQPCRVCDALVSLSRGPGDLTVPLPVVALQVVERQVDSLPGLRRAKNRFGHLHIFESVPERGLGRPLSRADGVDEVGLDGPLARLGR